MTATRSGNERRPVNVMQPVKLTALLLGLAIVAPAAYAQSCATGLVQVCITPVACACVLPGQGSSDPIIRDFSGRQFEFFGEPDSFYTLYSDCTHQVNMKLFPGFVDGHNGTYMRAFGAAFHDFRVNVTLLPDGDISVETWEETGNALRLEAHALLVSSEATHHKLGQSKSKAMTVASEPFRAFHGRVVDIITGVLAMSIWSVPPGTKDTKGIEQPAYLNFNLTLRAAPAGDVAEGIIGESLQAVLHRQSQLSDNLLADSEPNTDSSDTFDGKGLTNDYRVESLFGTDFAFNRFGKNAASRTVSRRSLLTPLLGGLRYPLRSTSAA